MKVIKTIDGRINELAAGHVAVQATFADMAAREPEDQYRHLVEIAGKASH